MAADFDLQPGTPPKPTQPPSERRIKGVQGGHGQWAQTPASGARRERTERRTQTVNKTKTRNGGGFNPSVNPSISINVTKGPNVGAAQGGSPGPGRSGGTGVPGAGFMSNEDIHKFAEHIRKEGRKRAGERAMDAEQLEQVLRNIPDAAGSMAGARMRARRVTRHLKRIAKAEQLIAKEGAALYSQFEREYEAELRKISPARQKPTRQPFRFA